MEIKAIEITYGHYNKSKINGIKEYNDHREESVGFNQSQDRRSVISKRNDSIESYLRRESQEEEMFDHNRVGLARMRLVGK